MNHLKPKSDSALKQKVEEQVAKVDVQQAVREVAPPPLQDAVPGEVLHYMSWHSTKFLKSRIFRYVGTIFITNCLKVSWDSRVELKCILQLEILTADGEQD